MSKISAGTLLYRKTNQALEVLLIHMGGPFWAKKDKGVWSIPKGEFEDEEPLKAAKREFAEEIGQDLPDVEVIELDSTKLKSGKVIYAWVTESNLDVTNITSSTFNMEWPPKSGQMREFPEIDRAAWFKLEIAAQKIHPAQQTFLEQLAKILSVIMEKPEQASLF